MRMVEDKNINQTTEEEKNSSNIIEKENKETVENFETEIKVSMVVEHNKKSFAKASGVKSVFINNDEIIMTSFGRGNDAVVEKIIKDNNIDDENKDKPVYDVVAVENEGNIIKVQSKRFKNTESANTEIPPERNGMDLIKRKDKLEEIYFGHTFNDNIHIQLIYNILDIEKILSVYINNIVYALGNLERKETDEEKDLIGYSSARAKYEDFIEKVKLEKIEKPEERRNLGKRKKLLEEFIENGDRLGYFGNVFFKNDKELKSEKEIYNIIGLLGSLRQFCFHYNEAVFENEKGKINQEYKSNYWLYNLGQLFDEFKETLNGFYNEKIDSINKGFIKTNQINLHIICSELGMKMDKKQVVGDYYDFIIAKKHKNMGFSIKKIREYMFDIYEAFDIKDKKFDSVRSILYKLIDFVIYYSFIHYKKDVAENIVSRLRVSLSEEDKDKVYKEIAKDTWNEYKDQINKLKELLTKRIGEFSDAKNKNVYYKEFEDIKFDEIGKKELGENADYFCKLMYLLTLFLDGKEINDLLTTLINKFDNIRSFIEIMKEKQIECNFDEKFSFFDESKNICDTVREVNSFARMQRPLENMSVKREMYRDAIKILLKDVKAEDEDVDKILADNIPNKKNKNKKKDFRNFIIKNIIKSRRFIYLVKYSNPTDVMELASNRNVVKFVLKTIPKAQIDRYYNSCGLPLEEDNNVQIEKLSEIITNIDYIEFLDVQQSHKNEDKSKKQAVVTLYLTILYQLTKNLVNVNSRYVIALHCLERDSKLYNINNLNKFRKKEKVFPPKYHKLTQYFIDNRYFDRKKKDRKNGEYISKKISGYIEKNMKNYIECEQMETLEQYRSTEVDMFINYRNSIAHLNTVRKASKYINDIKYFETYFELYHCIMQRYLKDKLKDKLKDEVNKVENMYIFKQYFNNLEENKKYAGTYIKDLVKVLNIPFAYKYPRYQNLSIDELFDRNNTRTIKKYSVEELKRIELDK